MARFRDIWVGVALTVSLLLPVYFLAAAMGTKFHIVPWTTGFVQMTVIWGPRLAIGAGVLALIALLIALFTPPRRGIVSALVALLVPVLILGYAFYVRQQASGVPAIHDISTDLVDPPAFSQDVVTARAAIPEGNALELVGAQTPDGRLVTELQRAAYPDIAPVTTTLAPDRAFDTALALMRERKWVIGRTDTQSGVIEATTQSFWYGFTDDIIVRVRPEGSGARIDMRSVSRVGRSDLGANAARMRPFLSDLRTRLLQAEGS